MISPSNLMSRFGVGGRLVAFFKAVCVYFVVGGGGGGAGAVAAKCAPVVCLLITVLAHYSQETDTTRKSYCGRVALGLALSVLGDALLVWPQYFVAGMAAFAAAHLAYLTAFGFTPANLKHAALLYLATGLFLPLLQPTGMLVWLVPLYALLLSTMCWRGAARGGAAAAGAQLFLLSDAALGYSMFAKPFAYSQVVVMSTYYLAQLCIALSALDSPPPPAH